jgi:endonuclease V-like protein UPF0215 family
MIPERESQIRLAMTNHYSHVIGVDDAPFRRGYRGDVVIVGAIFAGTRLEGVVHGRVRRDGVNSTQRIAEMILKSRFASHLQLVLLQGIAVAGFNVVDIHGLAGMLSKPVMVVMRRPPDFAAIRDALLHNVPGARRKLRLVEAAGDVESMEQVFVQRAGIALSDARVVVRQLALFSHLPEPLRTAHLIAGGMSPMQTRQRA